MALSVRYIIGISYIHLRRSRVATYQLFLNKNSIVFCLMQIWASKSSLRVSKPRAKKSSDVECTQDLKRDMIENGTVDSAEILQTSWLIGSWNPSICTAYLYVRIPGGAGFFAPSVCSSFCSLWTEVERRIRLWRRPSHQSAISKSNVLIPSNLFFLCVVLGSDDWIELRR